MGRMMQCTKSHVLGARRRETVVLPLQGVSKTGSKIAQTVARCTRHFLLKVEILFED